MGDADRLVLLEAPPPATIDEERAEWKEWKHKVPRLAGRIGRKGSLLLVSRNGYRDGELVPWGYQLADLVTEAGGLHLKNVYVRHDALRSPEGKSLAAGHELIFFFVKDLKSYYFDKDPLRKPHIFKDLDWGGRTEGVTGYHDKSRKSRRYPDGGRDPGNVFYRDHRSQDGAVTRVSSYPRDEFFAELVRALSAPGWTVIGNALSGSLRRTMTSEGRVVEVST